MQDYKNFILPIKSNDYDFGCGFFVGNYFITAGHIFNSNTIHTFCFQNKNFILDPNEAIFLKSNTDNLPDNEVQDVAIFKFDNINSPLSLSGSMPEKNSKFTNYSFIHSRNQNLNKHFIMIDCDCKVLNRIFNFFECQTSLTIRQGCSGSPLICNNVVYGILSGCFDEINTPNKILFCSTLNLPHII